MKYSDIFTIASAHIDAGDTKTVISIEGEPGIAKTALAYNLQKKYGFDHFIDLNFSLLDVPDVAGLALLGADGEALTFKYPEAMLKLRNGRNFLLIDEAPDSTMLMQNLARRLLWTREVNGVRLSDETFIMLTGNRSKDKSGAGKMSGKVKTAVTRLEMEANLDDWVEWALTDGNIDPVLIQFLRFKPNLLQAYNADAEVCPTCRQWELVNKVPVALPTNLFFADVAGKVGEGPAAEYAAFRKIYAALVSFEDIVMNPKGVKIPTDLSAQYAIVGSVAHNTTPQTIERVAEFVERMPSDFGIMFWQDSIKKTPALKTTKPFIKWATSSSNVILN
jgi:hypothetical protein